MTKVDLSINPIVPTKCNLFSHYGTVLWRDIMRAHSLILHLSAIIIIYGGAKPCWLGNWQVKREGVSYAR